MLNRADGKIVNIKNRPPLEGLVGFDAKAEYPYREGMKHLDKKRTQTEMGVISNLITDMTMIGAKDEELVRAVKYANTVIDADKHNLDWQRSYKENEIESLKSKVQDLEAQLSQQKQSKDGLDSTEVAKEANLDSLEILAEVARQSHVVPPKAAAAPQFKPIIDHIEIRDDNDLYNILETSPIDEYLANN